MQVASDVGAVAIFVTLAELSIISMPENSFNKSNAGNSCCIAWYEHYLYWDLGECLSYLHYVTKYERCQSPTHQYAACIRRRRLYWALLTDVGWRMQISLLKPRCSWAVLPDFGMLYTSTMILYRICCHMFKHHFTSTMQWAWLEIIFLCEFQAKSSNMLITNALKATDNFMLKSNYQIYS